MRYRLTRDRVQTLVLEVDADSPEQAVKRACLARRAEWAELDGAGLAPIDSVSEGGEGRCWGVSCELSGAVMLLEVEP